MVVLVLENSFVLQCSCAHEAKMENPISYPRLPYIGAVHEMSFRPGKLIRIRGVTPSFAYRFNICLQCTPNVLDDIGLRLSVLLDGFIALNSSQNGIWGEEQRGPTLPIKRTEGFEVIILCDFNLYKIAINGRHYCEFSQRMPYDRITHLAIDGDVSINQISYESSSGELQIPSAPSISVMTPTTTPVLHGQSTTDKASSNTAHSRLDAVPAGCVQPPPSYDAIHIHRPPQSAPNSPSTASTSGTFSYPPEISLAPFNETSSNDGLVVQPNTTKKEGATYSLIILMMGIVLFFVICLL